MNNNLIDLITLFDSRKNTRNDILSEVVEKLFEKYNSINKKDVWKKLISREEQITTGLGDGVAIPHTIVEGLENPVLVFLSLKNEVDWNSLDGKNVKLVFCIFVPSKDPSKHLEILSSISTILLNNDKKQKLFKAKDYCEVREMLLLPKKELLYTNFSLPVKEYDLVAITACPSGLAHTFLSKIALENEATKRKLKIKVETRGANGIENYLTDDEINGAKKLIIAVDKEMDLTRYRNTNTKYFRTIDIVRNPSIAFEENRINFIKKNYILFYNSAIFSLTKFFAITKVVGLLLGIFYMLNNYFAINSFFITETKSIIKIFSTIVICCFTGFVAQKISKSEETFIFVVLVILFANQSLSFTKNVQSGVLISTLIAVLWALYTIFFNKILTLKIPNVAFLKPLFKLFFEIIGVFVFLICIYFLGKYLTLINYTIFNFILYLSNSYFIFNTLVVLILTILYLWDLGGPLNKWTMLVCYMSYWSSINYDINNLWLYPFTVILFAPALPNFILSIPILIFAKQYSKTAVDNAKIAFKSGFRPITEFSRELIIEFKYKAITSIFLAILVGSFLIGIFKLQFYGGISSPLGFIFGYVDQGNMFYGVYWFLMYIISILTGAIIFTLLNFKRKER